MSHLQLTTSREQRDKGITLTFTCQHGLVSLIYAGKSHALSAGDVHHVFLADEHNARKAGRKPIYLQAVLAALQATEPQAQGLKVPSILHVTDLEPTKAFYNALAYLTSCEYIERITRGTYRITPKGLIYYESLVSSGQ